MSDAIGPPSDSRPVVKVATYLDASAQWVASLPTFPPLPSLDELVEGEP